MKTNVAMPAKTNRRGRVWSRASLTAFALLACSARAADRYWNTATGDWFTAANWNPPSVPTGSDDAYLQNGGTAQIGGGTAYADDLYISLNSRLELSAGTLDMNYAGKRQYIGYADGQTGTFAQTGGNNNIGFHLY